MDGSPPTCRVGTGAPSVVLVVADPTLRRLMVELLERDPVCWQLRAVADEAELVGMLAAGEPDLVILDTGDFARCCRDSLHCFSRRRIIVIGPEPDAAYERAARRAGAGAWLPRDRVGEDLTGCMRRVLGSTRGPAASPPPDRLHACCHNPRERR